jgi:TRAP-type mannitol/chloroaromatic compound transport system substrate-binding protein
MSDEQVIDHKKVLEQRLDLFQKEAWQSLHKELTEQLNVAIETADTNCVTNDQWQYHKGQVAMMRYFLSLERIAGLSLDALNREDTDEDVL